MVWVRRKQDEELALEGKEKVQVGEGKQEFQSRRKESISWCCCSRDILAVHPQFLGVSPVPAPGELLELLVRAPGWLSCSSVYKQPCIAKVSRIYNVTAPCESPELGLNSETSLSKSRSCHSPR